MSEQKEGHRVTDDQLVADRAARGGSLPSRTGDRRDRRTDTRRSSRALHRLELELLEVRVERLQKLTKEDAIAEGAFSTKHPTHDYSAPTWSMVETTSHEQCLGSPQMAFANLYNVLHAGPRWNCKPGVSPWDQDPFVWDLRFRVEPNPELLDDEPDGSDSPRQLSGALDGGGPP